jgi:hypothetical protein
MTFFFVISTVKASSNYMNMIKLKLRLFFPVLVSALALSLAACASTPSAFPNCMNNNHFYQSFSFDMRESPEAELRDYFYGIQNCPALYNPPYLKDRGDCLQIHSEFGSTRRAEKLYVKWRIKATGQEYEDTVDLKKRLPMDMTNHELHFSVKGSLLYVYLVTPERRPQDMPPNGPKKFQAHKTITIYPN